MRVTEGQMMALAEAGVSNARTAASKAADEMSSGKRVQHAADDPTAWADGMRANARNIASEARGRATARATDNLTASDSAFSQIGTVLSTAHELAIQMATGTMTASDRAAAASTVSGLFDTALAAANTQSVDGEYIFGGDKSGAAPFTSTGLFVGSASQRTVEVSESGSQLVNISGSPLTSASGVDVFATLTALQTALSTNNATNIQTSVGDLTTAISQVAHARTQVGGMQSLMQSIDSDRQSLEVRLAAIQSNATDADTNQAASDLTQARNNLDASSAVAAQIVAMVKPRE